ncbi:MAG: hypothetical protein K6F69_04945 [Treponema sp.]|nr:hypothetical protein [Treponema sp.]
MKNIVVFTGGKAPCLASLNSYFTLHGKPDFVIAADSGLAVAESYGKDFEADFILGDMDSLDDIRRLDKYPKEIVKTFIRDKDYTDTELAIKKALELDSNAFITLIGGGGGRIDHFFAIYEIFSWEKSMNVWLPGTEASQALYFISAGNTAIIENLTVDDDISVCRPSNCYDKGFVESEGLEWEGACFNKKGMPSVSNRISKAYEGKSVKIKACDGNFVLILPVKAACRIF